MDLLLNNTINKLSETYLFKDISNSIVEYINILDYYNVKYDINDIQCLAKSNNIIVFVNSKLGQILVYNGNTCIHRLSLKMLSMDYDIKRIINSIDINKNFIILGTLYGDLYIINIDDNSVQHLIFYENITLLKFFNDEYFILSTMDNKIHLCDIYANIISSIDIESYIISFKKRDEYTNMFITGSIDGKIQYWDFNAEQLVWINTYSRNFGNCIHSIVTFNDKLHISYTDSKYIYKKMENNHYTKVHDLFVETSIISMANFDDKYLVLLCEDGFIYIYDKLFNLQKEIFVDIYNAFAKIYVFAEKILVESNTNVKIITF